MQLALEMAEQGKQPIAYVYTDSGQCCVGIFKSDRKNTDGSQWKPVNGSTWL